VVPFSAPGKRSPRDAEEAFGTPAMESASSRYMLVIIDQFGPSNFVIPLLFERLKKLYRTTK
jgi:hypothetical protein